MSDLAGRVAVVTGAAHGIGRAIAEAFLGNNGRVVAVDTDATELARGFGERPEAAFLAADVTAADTPEQAVAAALDVFGRLDIVVNNAGIVIAGPFEDLTDEQFDRILDVNVRSVFRLTRAAVPYLRESPAPRVINLGSIMSELAGPALSIYGTSKHAVAGLTKGMAVDLGRYGITVNYLQPGSIVTRLSEPFMDDPQFKAYWEAKAPVGRLGQPEEVAAAALFLAAEESRFISGVGLNVDGGAIVQF